MRLSLLARLLLSVALEVLAAGVGLGIVGLGSTMLHHMPVGHSTKLLSGHIVASLLCRQCCRWGRGSLLHSVLGCRICSICWLHSYLCSCLCSCLFHMCCAVLCLRTGCHILLVLFLCCGLFLFLCCCILRGLFLCRSLSAILAFSFVVVAFSFVSFAFAFVDASNIRWCWSTAKVGANTG